MIVRSAAFLDGSEKAADQWKPSGAFPRSGPGFESETRRGSYLSPIIGF